MSAMYAWRLIVLNLNRIHQVILLKSKNKAWEIERPLIPVPFSFLFLSFYFCTTPFRVFSAFLLHPTPGTFWSNKFLKWKLQYDQSTVKTGWCWWGRDAAERLCLSSKIHASAPARRLLPPQSTLYYLENSALWRLGCHPRLACLEHLTLFLAASSIVVLGRIQLQHRGGDCLSTCVESMKEPKFQRQI